MKKLECTINYNGRGSGKVPGRNGEFSSETQMKLKILSWNVRGVNDRDKRLVRMAFFKSQRAELVCLQETKIQKLDPGMVRNLGDSRFSPWGAVDALGAAGGIFFFFWDKRVLEMIDMVIGFFSISCRFKNCEDGFLWTFSGVYGPVLNCSREAF